jgi:hypothetical protein
VEPAVCTVYGLPYRWGLREASAAYVLGDTSMYKEKKFLAKVVHKAFVAYTSSKVRPLGVSWHYLLAALCSWARQCAWSIVLRHSVIKPLKIIT